MSDVTTVVVSVRGDARRVVSPDCAVLGSAIDVVAASKAEALRAAASAQMALVEDLIALGAVQSSAEVEKPPLAWSAQSVTSSPEYDFDKRTGGHGPTGNVVASVSVVISVRDLARLADLGAVLVAHDRLSVHGVSWQVDADNTAWPVVRAAAIHAAIAKGRDYAAALAGTLVRVEQIADVGLLGGEGSPMPFLAAGGVADMSARSPGSGPSDTPSLDPVPQTLHAAIDARFVASIPALA